MEQINKHQYELIYCMYCNNNNVDENTYMCNMCYDDNSLLAICLKCSEHFKLIDDEELICKIKNK